jgi:hypothetical protein
MRFYFNETLIAAADISEDERVSFEIGRGLESGSYRVRLDEVDRLAGAVKSRAEVIIRRPGANGSWGRLGCKRGPDARGSQKTRNEPRGIGTRDITANNKFLLKPER